MYSTLKIVLLTLSIFLIEEVIIDNLRRRAQGQTKNSTTIGKSPAVIMGQRFTEGARRLHCGTWFNLFGTVQICTKTAAILYNTHV